MKLLISSFFFVAIALNSIAQNRLDQQSELTQLNNKILQVDSLQKTSCEKIEKFITEQAEKDSRFTTEIKALFSDANEIVAHKEKTVDLWLSVLAVFVTLLSIGVPLSIGFISRRFFKDYQEQRERIDKEFEKDSKRQEKEIEVHKMKMETQLTTLVGEAQKIIEQLKLHETSGLKITERLNSFLNIDVKNDISKEKASSEAKDIANNDLATDFQKSLALAYDDYYSDKWDNAISKFTSIINLQLSDISALQLADIYYKIADSYLNTDKYQEAVDFFEKHNELEKNNYNALCNTGYAYQKLFSINKDEVNLAKARNYYDNAILMAKNTNDSWIWTRLAEIEVILFNYEEAIKYYKNAILSNNSDDSIKLSLIECYIFANSLESAKSDLKQYLSIHPNNCFDTRYLSALIQIISGNENVMDLYSKIRECCGNNKETIGWDLIELSSWINSEKSDFLGNKKTKVNELLSLLNKWE